MSNRLISEILNEPHAYLLIQAIEAALENKKQRRISFYNDLTEQQKAEFINGEIIVYSPVMKRPIQHRKANTFSCS
jgi:hypothetical protein